jgi:tellurite resistance protein TehA-like permease
MNEQEHEKELLLPIDERWPFLLRFPVSFFCVCMGLGSQVILWKNLSSSTQLHFLHIPLQINLTLWCLALFVLILIFVTYSLKIIFFYEAVRREFHHPVRVNFFFAPWIACMFLALGLPSAISQSSAHPAVWCIFMAPVFALELRIYGQWLSGSARRLSKVANACTHLSVVGNFVGALLGATVGWIEPAIFFWAVGLAHYLVVFVTLYQHLPSDISLPKDLHPVFFLFVAAPSTASVAWMHITGRFDLVSRLVFFMALFLYSSLVVRINFFRGIRSDPYLPSCLHSWKLILLAISFTSFHGDCVLTSSEISFSCSFRYSPAIIAFSLGFPQNSSASIFFIVSPLPLNFWKQLHAKLHLVTADASSTLNPSYTSFKYLTIFIEAVLHCSSFTSIRALRVETLQHPSSSQFLSTAFFSLLNFWDWNQLHASHCSSRYLTIFIEASLHCSSFLPGMRAFELRLLGILCLHSSVTMSFSLLNFWEMDEFTASCISLSSDNLH